MEYKFPVCVWVRFVFFFIFSILLVIWLKITRFRKKTADEKGNGFCIKKLHVGNTHSK